MGLQFLNPATASFILCVVSLARCSDSVCEVNGKTYNEGDSWQEIDKDQQCFQHVCLKDGSFNTNKCNPEHNNVEDTVVETTAKPVDLDRSLPTNKSSTGKPPERGCMVDDREVAVGEQVDVPNKCLHRACAGEDRWIMKACPLIGLAPGWILTPEDVSKPYPSCCGRAAPLLNIVPDVVSTLHWSVSLKLTSPNHTVEYGNELSPAAVTAEPEVDFWAEPDSWYLLSMVDPDASPQNTQFLHWLVGNIQGNDVSSGDVLAEYVGSGPPPGFGLHRYVFLLYKQPGNITFDEPALDTTSVEGRRNFSMSKFSGNYSLGDPIALNFFVAQHDDASSL